jgi:hypothetical protein
VNLRLAAVALCAVPIVLAFAVQERVKPKAAEDVPALLAKTGETWKAKQYRACLTNLKQALHLVTVERMKAIRAALPAAPAGFEKEAHAEEQDAAANPFLAAMSAGVGSVVEQSYSSADGSGSLRVTITADSPLTQMFSMWVANPKLLEPGSELIKYGAHNAVLKKQGSGWQLMTVIDQDLCEVNVDGRDDDFLLKFFDQAAVDRLAACLAT